MKRIILAGILLALILIVGCQKAVEQTVASSETSSEESELNDNLNELEELDTLDKELDVDFEEMEGYLK